MKNRNNEVIIPCSKATKPIMIIAALSVLLLLWLHIGIFRRFIQEGRIEAEINTIILMLFTVTPLLLFAINYGIVEYLRLTDFARFSTEVIELNLHQSILFWRNHSHDKFTWKDIRKCTVEQKIVRRNGLSSIQYLQLLVEGEDNYREYSFDHMQNSGKDVFNILKFYKKHPYYHEAVVHTSYHRDDDTIGDYLTGVIFIISLYLEREELFDHTIISFWVFVAVILVSLIIAFFVRNLSTLKILTHYALAFSIGLILCYLLLLINYSFADWRSPADLRSYPIYEYDHYSQEKSKGFVNIVTENGNKKIDLDNKEIDQIGSNNTMLLELHRGALGFKVYKQYSFTKKDK